MNTYRQKTGGRQRGTPNRRTQEFADLYDEHASKHGDPLLTLFEIQGDKDVEPSLRIRAAADLLPYRYPKRKAVELTTVDPEVSHGTVDEVTARIQELLGNGNVVESP